MTLDEYQKAAMKFAEYGRNPMYPYLGLVEEIGEFAAKAGDCRKPVGDLMSEDGDIRWMIAAIAKENKLKLSEVAVANPSAFKTKLEGAGSAEAHSLDYLLGHLFCFAAQLCGQTAEFIRKHEGFTPQKATRWVSMREAASAYRISAIQTLCNALNALNAIADVVGYTPEDSMEANIAKLNSDALSKPGEPMLKEVKNDGK